jgi:hypothetical protein
MVTVLLQLVAAVDDATVAGTNDPPRLQQDDDGGDDDDGSDSDGDSDGGDSGSGSSDSGSGDSGDSGVSDGEEVPDEEDGGEHGDEEGSDDGDGDGDDDDDGAVDGILPQPLHVVALSLLHDLAECVPASLVYDSAMAMSVPYISNESSKVRYCVLAVIDAIVPGCASRMKDDLGTCLRRRNRLRKCHLTARRACVATNAESLLTVLLPMAQDPVPGVVRALCVVLSSLLHHLFPDSLHHLPSMLAAVLPLLKSDNAVVQQGGLDFVVRMSRLCCAVLCCAVLCCAVLCCAVLCCAVLCCAVLCCAVLCCAVLL